LYNKIIEKFLIGTGCYNRWVENEPHLLRAHLSLPPSFFLFYKTLQFQIFHRYWLKMFRSSQNKCEKEVSAGSSEDNNNNNNNNNNRGGEQDMEGTGITKGEGKRHNLALKF
jgi:hypothetical protein